MITAVVFLSEFVVIYVGLHLVAAAVDLALRSMMTNSVTFADLKFVRIGRARLGDGVRAEPPTRRLNWSQGR